MNREIKFRFWNGNTKEMHEQDETWDKFPLCGENECFMQYTGLKDKNGKEIYEGDEVLIVEDVVVEVIAGHERRETEGRLEIVKWEDGAWFIGDELAWEEAKYCEIIGNIYENKDLLT